MTKKSEDPDVVDGQETADPRPPTPVRQVMEAGETDESGPGEPRVIEDPESGQEWIVTVSGRSASGILPRRSIWLVDLVFSRTQGPGEPERQALVRDRDLEDISDSELISLLHRAKPYCPPLRESEGESRRGQSRRGRRGRPSS